MLHRKEREVNGRVPSFNKKAVARMISENVFNERNDTKTTDISKMTLNEGTGNDTDKRNIKE